MPFTEDDWKRSDEKRAAMDRSETFDFALGERPYRVYIDPQTAQIACVQFRGYDTCNMDYPDGPADAMAKAREIFEQWLSRR
jgi:hypothetical protein